VSKKFLGRGSKSADTENAIRENGVPGEAKRDDNTEVTEGRTQRTQRRKDREEGKRRKFVAFDRQSPSFPPEAGEGWGTPPVLC
jgi:hypothetical protein